MILTSHWSGNVFWRMFDSLDTTYVVGWAEGIIKPGEKEKIRHHPQGTFQLELKRDGLFGSVLVPAGQQFTNDAEFVLTESGELVDIEDTISVTLGPPQLEPWGTVVQFFQQGSVGRTMMLASSLTQRITQSGSTGSVLRSEASTATEVGAGVEQSVEGSAGPLQLGIKAHQDISSRVERKITNEVARLGGYSVSTESSFSTKDEITLLANRLTVVTTRWNRRYLEGSVDLGNGPFHVDVTVEYAADRDVLDYASPAELPPDVLAEYMRRNPEYRPEPISHTVGNVAGLAVFPQLTPHGPTPR